MLDILMAPGGQQWRAGEKKCPTIGLWDKRAMVLLYNQEEREILILIRFITQ